MEAILSLGIGYLAGSLSPSALVGRLNKTDVRESGTGNLGATNTMLVLGWGAGIFVMVFDLMKSFLSGKLAQLLFPSLRVAGMLGCIGSMVGHCFPVFHHFRGGKGLATFGGLVIYCGVRYVPIVLAAGLAMMLLFDSTVAFPLTVSALLPLLAVRLRQNRRRNLDSGGGRACTRRHAHQQPEKSHRRRRNHARSGLS